MKYNRVVDRKYAVRKQGFSWGVIVRQTGVPATEKNFWSKRDAYHWIASYRKAATQKNAQLPTTRKLVGTLDEIAVASLVPTLVQAARRRGK